MRAQNHEILKQSVLTNTEFTHLLKPIYNDAVNYCRALCAGQQMAEAEEIMQQSLLKAYENIDSLNNSEKFKSWFFQIITRTFYNAVRLPFWKRFVRQSEAKEIDFQIYEDHFFQENQHLMAALSTLESKERAALLLFELGGFSIREITAIQEERSESTIKSRLSRTRTKLREIMEQMEESGSGSAIPASTKLETSDLYHETSKLINQFKSMG